jgi:hypothetical protein
MICPSLYVPPVPNFVFSSLFKYSGFSSMPVITVEIFLNLPLICFDIIIRAVIQISIYFFESPLFVIEMTLIAFLLFGVYGTVGYTITLVVSRGNKSITNGSKSNTRESKRTAATEGFIAMAYVNNILVAVFAEQFFGIQSAVLSASYNIPYFIGIIILKKLYSVQVHPVKN